jgi:hypothetical protein
VQNFFDEEEVEALQHGCSRPPQLPHAPYSVSEHFPRLAPQAEPAATQRLLAQQASPAQERASQQGCPGFPHGLSVPSLQMVPVADPIVPFGMQSFRPGSAQPPFWQGVPVAQGGLPRVPQVSSVFSATQTAPPEVEVPSAMQSEPEQQPFAQPL